jgi:hypothetical protein
MLFKHVPNVFVFLRPNVFAMLFVPNVVYDQKKNKRFWWNFLKLIALQPSPRMRPSMLKKSGGLRNRNDRCLDDLSETGTFKTGRANPSQQASGRVGKDIQPAGKQARLAI